MSAVPPRGFLFVAPAAGGGCLSAAVPALRTPSCGPSPPDGGGEGPGGGERPTPTAHAYGLTDTPTVFSHPQRGGAGL
ncbi:hypothetical protein T261_6121 [Streptomyces lydicus]|nr:hypothetical protein T261_6121 [Streptomyces lydicus]